MDGDRLLWHWYAHSSIRTTPALEQVRAGVGRFHLVADHVRQRRLHHRMRRIGFLGRPVAERRAEPMRHSRDSQLPQQGAEIPVRQEATGRRRKHQTGRSLDPPPPRPGSPALSQTTARGAPACASSVPAEPSTQPPPGRSPPTALRASPPTGTPSGPETRSPA